MRYLVTMKTIDTAMPPSPDQIIQFMENKVIPHHEALTKLEAEKKILAGGICAGQRAGVAIVEAASNEELSQMLHSLPFWGLVKVSVTPLVSFQDQAAAARKDLERLKAAAQ